MSPSRRRPRKPSTEQLNPLGEDLDQVSLREVVARLHREDVRAVAATGRVLNALARAASLVSRSLTEHGRLIYVGAGTSGRLAMLDAVECPPTFGTDPSLVQAVIAGGAPALTRSIEGAEDDSPAGVRAMKTLRVGAKDCVVGVTASSTTPFVRAALKEAKRRRARTILVCCNPLTSAARIADVVVNPRTGPELIAGSTRLKAGTATKLVLNALSTAAMVAQGKVFRGRMIDVLPTNHKLRERAVSMVAELVPTSPAKARSMLEQVAFSPRAALELAWGDGKVRSKKRSLRALQPRS